MKQISKKCSCVLKERDYEDSRGETAQAGHFVHKAARDTRRPDSAQA